MDLELYCNCSKDYQVLEVMPRRCFRDVMPFWLRSCWQFEVL